MSKLAYALSTQLKWQLHAIDHELVVLEQDLTNLDQNIFIIQQKILISCTIPAVIQPEQEIARTYFIMQQQLQQDELNISKAKITTQQATLKLKQIELNTTLKMLGKQMETTQKNKQHQLVLSQQNSTDEWILLQRARR